MPVVFPGESAAVHAAAGGVAANTNRLALRVPMTDYRVNPGRLSGETQAIASNAGVNATDVDVILDWADELDDVDLDDLVIESTAAIAALQGHHGTLITVGTPNSDDFVQVGDWTTERREWWLWLRLAHAGVDVTYGDYALYPPADPVPAAPQYGHLRYSSGDQLHVHRRARPSRGGGLGAAFKACCEHLVAQAHCMPATFSAADGRLHDIAAGTDKESQAGAWRQLAVEHHFALVADQLANPPAPPPPGTP
jgi:hypothetical protein